jgi:predicted tellurium resistance membrane protein TerC
MVSSAQLGTSATQARAFRSSLAPSILLGHCCFNSQFPALPKKSRTQRRMENLLTLAADPAAWAALVTLVALEVVLGIDNLIFIAIVTNKVPEEQRALARKVGIGLALVLRLLLLGTVALIVQLTQPIFSVFGRGFSWRDLILIAGGLFLVWKATKEIHHRVDPDPEPDLFDRKGAGLGLAAALGQIVVLDLVFSIDSIITAVGMTRDIVIMAIAVIVAVIAMMVAATPLSNFINANPTVVMLALGFLLMIGMVLLADGFGAHVPKGYIYAAMAFSVGVEALNMLARRAKRQQGPGADGPG